MVFLPRCFWLTMVPRDLRMPTQLVPRFISGMVLFDLPKCTYGIRLEKSESNKRYMNTLINYRVEDMV